MVCLKPTAYPGRVDSDLAKIRITPTKVGLLLEAFEEWLEPPRRSPRWLERLTPAAWTVAGEQGVSGRAEEFDVISKRFACGACLKS